MTSAIITAFEATLEPTRAERARLTRMLSCLGCETAPPLIVVIPGNPLPQERSRAAKGRARPHKTERMRAEQTRVGLALAAGINNPGPLAGNLAIAALFYRDSQRTVDFDNLLKLLMDAGTEARCWHDDSQFTAGAAVLELDRQHPRTVVAITPHQSSLRRDLRPVN